MTEHEQSELSLRKLTEDLTMLIEASSVLAGSQKLENVLPRTLDLCRSLITADAYAVWLHLGQSHRWSIVTSSGLSDGYQRMTIADIEGTVPILDKPMVVEDIETSTPIETRRALHREEGIRSLLVIPLTICGESVGTVVFYYKKPHRFSDAEVRIGVGIGNLVGASMTSIRIYENEFELRRQAEMARQRAAFLADLSTVLSQTLELQATLDKLVRLAVTAIPQSCTIYFSNEAADFFQVAMAHEDPEMEKLQSTFAQAYQPARNPGSTIRRAYESREAVLISEIAPKHLALPNGNARTAEILRVLDPKSVMVAPMVARGKSVGVMAFTTSNPKRRYNADDLKFALEIALHAAWMVDNARLYSEVLAADARKDRFLAMLGHELRNPLAPVLTGVEILSEANSSAAQRNESIEIVKRQVRHMSRIVDDLLDVSRIRSGRMAFKKEPADLVRIAAACAADHRQLFEKLNIEFQYSAPSQALWIDGDSVRIAQAISNLLNNASKFTPRGGRVHLIVARQSEAEATIVVKDSGAGIPPAMLLRLFETFTQADSSIDRGAGGLGMGLALVKGLIEGHDGKVAALSQGPGCGAEFTVTLPLMQMTPPLENSKPATPVTPVTGRRAQRILLIEDNAALAGTMSVLLGLAGHTVEVAANGVDGVRKAGEFAPEVILCDIGLPGELDGLAVARTLRKSGLPVKLVALTGYGGAADQEQSLNAGFDYHLTKPVDMKTLETILAAETMERGQPCPPLR